VPHLLDEGGREKVLGECMDKLPEPQRVAVTMFFLEELSYVEVAERAGYSLGAVKSYIQNGKRNLRICLEGKGIT
jgi:RNA polymerase sigma-70 factor (ECF subfamily)